MSVILHVTPESSQACIQEATECIGDGGVVAVGTESFYALAANALNPRAVSRVANLKDRFEDKPILTLIGDTEQLPLLVDNLSSPARLCISRFWPGPLTLILPTTVALPGELMGKSSTVGVRQPDTPFLRSLLVRTGPLTGTSANLRGAPPASTAWEVEAQFPTQLDLILDTGPSPGGMPSTLLELGSVLRVLRDGPITQEDLEAVLSPQGFRLSNGEGR